MIKNIKLTNFRKFNFLDLNVLNNVTIIIGKNAVGKTSILEAISLVSTSKSHRTTEYKNMIQTDKPYALVKIIADKKYEMILSEKGKKALINQIEYKKISDFIGNLKTVFFSPEDLILVTGNKLARRNFMDLEISMLDKKYLSIISIYKALLKQRNDLLKIYSEDKKLILQVLTSQLIEKCKDIMVYRSKFIEDLNKELKNIHLNISNQEEIALIYTPSILVDKLEEVFEAKLSYDILTKMTNYGVHRDDFKITLNKQIADDYASQGQIRGLVISIKIAVLELLKKQANQEVILLLDDVFSELDEARQGNLVRYLLKQGQTFISTTSISSLPIELVKSSQVIKIE